MFVALKWLKTSTETLKLKFDSIWTSILHESDVHLTSMCWKNNLRIKNQFWKFACALRLKSGLSITVCSWLSFLKQVSSLMVGAFSCYSVFTTLPYMFKQKNVINLVNVILELFILDKHSRSFRCAIYKTVHHIK